MIDNKIYDKIDGKVIYDFEVVKILANDDSEELLSIACHSFSHGGNNGLFEAWSKEQRSQGEEPDGFLSEWQVIRKIQKLNQRLSNNET